MQRAPRPSPTASSAPHEDARRLVLLGRARLATPGLLLGIGLGGLLDGVLLHQVLHWHHVLSDRTDDTDLNQLADGLFHVGSLLALLAGLVLLHRATHDGARAWSGRELTGWAMAGAGAFTLVEGVVDHLVLQIHHVRPGEDALWWDVGFLALGAVAVVLGLRLVQIGRGG